MQILAHGAHLTLSHHPASPVAMLNISLVARVVIVKSQSQSRPIRLYPSRHHPVTNQDSVFRALKKQSSIRLRPPTSLLPLTNDFSVCRPISQIVPESSRQLGTTHNTASRLCRRQITIVRHCYGNRCDFTLPTPGGWWLVSSQHPRRLRHHRQQPHSP